MIRCEQSVPGGVCLQEYMQHIVLHLTRYGQAKQLLHDVSYWVALELCTAVCSDTMLRAILSRRGTSILSFRRETHLSCVKCGRILQFLAGPRNRACEPFLRVHMRLPAQCLSCLLDVRPSTLWVVLALECVDNLRRRFTE